jgi:hypothetical protein
MDKQGLLLYYVLGLVGNIELENGHIKISDDSK